MNTAVVRVPVTERTNPWPWLTLIALMLVGGAVWLRGADTGSQGGYSVQSMPVSQPPPIDLGPLNTAIVVALSSPTPSPTSTPLATPTAVITNAMRYPKCTKATMAGTTCIPATDVPLTATAFPTCALHSKVYQDVCDMPGTSEDVSAETETQ